MKQHYFTLLLAAAGLLAGVQTVMAQKVVLHMAGNQTFECSLSLLDSITFSPEVPACDPKVRIGIYEAIPGYNVQNVEFYANAQTDVAQTSCVLFADESDETFTIDFGTIADTPLGMTMPNASFAGKAGDDYYTTCLPVEGGTGFTLRANYTIVSIDGSGEIIHVKGTSAKVPAEQAKWETGKGYTYIFKIYETLNWYVGQSVTELFPITLDAVIVKDSEGNTIVTTR